MLGARSEPLLAQQPQRRSSKQQRYQQVERAPCQASRRAMWTINVASIVPSSSIIEIYRSGSCHDRAAARRQRAAYMCSRNSFDLNRTEDAGVDAGAASTDSAERPATTSRPLLQVREIFGRFMVIARVFFRTRVHSIRCADALTDDSNNGPKGRCGQTCQAIRCGR